MLYIGSSDIHFIAESLYLGKWPASSKVCSAGEGNVKKGLPSPKDLWKVVEVISSTS